MSIWPRSWSSRDRSKKEAVCQQPTRLRGDQLGAPRRSHEIAGDNPSLWQHTDEIVGPAGHLNAAQGAHVSL